MAVTVQPAYGIGVSQAPIVPNMKMPMPGFRVAFSTSVSVGVMVHVGVSSCVVVASGPSIGS